MGELELIEDEWFKPYENFDLNSIRDNIHFANYLEKTYDFKISNNVLNELILPFYSSEIFGIGFDYTVLNKRNNSRCVDGCKIYFPLGLPDKNSINERENGDGFVVRGFANIWIVKNIVKNDEIARFNGIEVYPYKLSLRTPSGYFYSISKEVTRLSPEHDNHDVPAATFYLWKPEDSDLEEWGEISIPTELPYLKILEFKLSKIDPYFVFERIFQYNPYSINAKMKNKN